MLEKSRKPAKNDIYKTLCYEFVGRNRRLYGMELLKAPIEIVDAERNAVQAVYNKMRELCLKDPVYIELWEHVDPTDIPPTPETPELPESSEPPEPPTEDKGNLVPA